MEAKIKRKTRKRVINYTKYYYSGVIIGVVLFFAMLISVLTMPVFAQNNKSIISISGIVISIFIFGGMLFGAFAQINGIELIKYKHQIEAYRLRNKFKRIITNALNQCDIMGMILIYNGMKEDGDLKTYARGLIIAFMLKSDHEIKIDEAKKLLNEVIAENEPENVFN